MIILMNDLLGFFLNNIIYIAIDYTLFYICKICRIEHTL